MTTATRTVNAFTRAVAVLLCGCKAPVAPGDDHAALPLSDWFCERHGMTTVIRRERRNW